MMVQELTVLNPGIFYSTYTTDVGGMKAEIANKKIDFIISTAYIYNLFEKWVFDLKSDFKF